MELRTCVPSSWDVMSKLPLPHEVHWPDGAVFTLGHSTLAIEDFIAVLRAYAIERVVDIRTIAKSRHNPQFGEEELAASLHAANLEYERMRGLGGLRPREKDSPNGGWRNKSFQGYADYMQTDAFEVALVTLIATGREKRVAIMCAEGVPWRCHRSLVADAMSVRRVPVVEILGASSYRIHTLTPFARVEGVRITYPPEQAALGT